MGFWLAVDDLILRLHVMAEVLVLVTITDIVETHIVMDSTVQVEVTVNQLGGLQEEIQRERAVLILVPAVTGQSGGHGRELLQPGQVLVLLQPRHVSGQ